MLPMFEKLKKKNLLMFFSINSYPPLFLKICFGGGGRASKQASKHEHGEGQRKKPALC